MISTQGGKRRSLQCRRILNGTACSGWRQKSKKSSRGVCPDSKEYEYFSGHETRRWNRTLVLGEGARSSCRLSAPIHKRY